MEHTKLPVPILHFQTSEQLLSSKTKIPIINSSPKSPSTKNLFFIISLFLLIDHYPPKNFLYLYVSSQCQRKHFSGLYTLHYNHTVIILDSTTVIFNSTVFQPPGFHYTRLLLKITIHKKKKINIHKKGFFSTKNHVQNPYPGIKHLHNL